MSFTGRTTLITGAAGGLGAACARLAVAQGSNVMLFDQSPRVHEFAAELGERAMAFVGDVTNPDHLAEAAAAARRRDGRIDHLIACAGVIHAGNVEQTSVEDWSHIIAINLTGLFLTCRAVLPAMVEQKSGSIVTFASQFGQVAAPRLAAYCASKGGVIQLTRAIALDYETHGIRANCLCPGMTQTHMLQEIFTKMGPSKEWSNLLRAMPQPIENPEHIAQVALFLASDRAAAMNGAVVTADGGYTAR